VSKWKFCASDGCWNPCAYSTNASCCTGSGGTC
jgi:hypothetical protein